MEKVTNREILISCISEKAHIKICFGWLIDFDNSSADTLDTDLIQEGCADAFWENHCDFEAALFKVNALLKDNPYISTREALNEIFGHFTLIYEIDGIERTPIFDFNATDFLYKLLENDVGIR